MEIDKNMSQKREMMEKLMAIALFSYAIRLSRGEELREIVLSER